MSFVAILIALLIEQARPLSADNPVHASVRRWVRWVMRNLDAGKTHHGQIAWWVAVGAPSLVAVLVHWLLVVTVGWLAALVWNIGVLYCTLGFRQFSHHFTSIRDALLAGNEEAARQGLARWMRMDASELPRSEIVRHVIEFSMLSAHRHVFGVFAWFSLFAALGLGPAGAVIYRISELNSRIAKRPARPASSPISPAFSHQAIQAWHWIDWIPARLTALSFAFVGSFEEAIDSWRHYAQQHPDDNDGVVLAATAGAVNVQLGEAQTALAGQHQVPQLLHLRAVVGLVWRTVVMWMILLAVLSLARLLG
jgi:adenosylcobinamide-phosphate synthase